MSINADLIVGFQFGFAAGFISTVLVGGLLLWVGTRWK